MVTFLTRCVALLLCVLLCGCFSNQFSTHQNYELKTYNELDEEWHIVKVYWQTELIETFSVSGKIHRTDDAYYFIDHETGTKIVVRESRYNGTIIITEIDSRDQNEQDD